MTAITPSAAYRPHMIALDADDEKETTHGA
jgi:hypothetical protein